MSNKDEYIRKLQTKLEELNVEINLLTAKAARITTDVKTEYSEQIELLKARQVVARQKLEELQHAGEGAWSDMKSGAELAWTAMVEAIDSARSRFK